MEELIKKLSLLNITIHISCVPVIKCLKVILSTPKYCRELLINIDAATTSYVGMSDYIQMEIERVVKEFESAEAFNV